MGASSAGGSLGGAAGASTGAGHSSTLNPFDIPDATEIVQKPFTKPIVEAGSVQAYQDPFSDLLSCGGPVAGHGGGREGGSALGSGEARLRHVDPFQELLLSTGTGLHE